MKRALILIVVFLLLAGAAAGLAWFQFRVKPEFVKGLIQGAGQPVPSVAAAPAASEVWTPRINEIGSLRALQGVDVAPQVAGVIRALRFESDQDVDNGAPLVQLDDSVEQADLKANLANLRNAELTFQRQQQLASGGAASRANLDSATAARDSAAAAVERTRAVIAQKAIAAPFAGRLGIRRVDVGQYVAAGTALVSLQQLDPIFVDFQSPEQQIANLKVGQAIEASVDAFPGERFKGKIRFLDVRVSTDTRQFLVRGEISNPDKKLRPGMFANVRIASGAPRETVVLPRTAIAYSLYGDSVFVARPLEGADGLATVERRAVKTGTVEDTRVAVLEGVKAGEIVVTEGQLKLQAGMKVRIDPKAGLPPLAPLPRQ